MAKTSTELVTQVLQELRIIASDETPSAADAVKVAADYVLALQTLEHQEIASWPLDAIPEAYFLPLSRYMAAVVAPAFGIQYMDIAMATRGLQAVTMKPYTGAAATLNYF